MGVNISTKIFLPIIPIVHFYPNGHQESLVYLLVVSITSVRYGASGALKTAGPEPRSPPCPAKRPVAGRFFFVFHAPAPNPADSLDGPR